MKKPKKHRAKNQSEKKQLPSKRTRRVFLLVAVGVITFLLLGGYTLVRQTYYSFKLKGIHSSEFGKIQEPLKKFGFEDASAPKPTCTNQEQYGSSNKQLLCVTTKDTYTEIGKKDDQIAGFVEQAKALDTKLAENGWETQSSSAKSFEEWIRGISIGNDFSTDINATKESGNARCILIMTVAYSNPNPPAVNTVTSCSSPNYPAVGTGAVISE